jgi:two-component system chemotaxis sensor kinase CheA
MKIDLSHFRETFMQESMEHVASMEALLLELRSAPDDIETLNAIFRSAHSIKGGAGSFGLTSLVRFTHALENLLDRLRSMEIPATEQVIAVLLQSVDLLHGMLHSGEQDTVPEGMPELLRQLQSLTSAAEPVALPAPVEDKADSGPELKVYKVDFRPAREMFSSGTNPIVLLRNLASLGTVSVCELHTDQLPSLNEIDPAQCYLRWTVELASVHSEAELREVFEFVEHLVELRIACFDPQPRNPPQTPLQTQPGPTALVRPELPLAGALAVVPATAAPLATSGSRTASRKPATAAEASSIRVATEKVDRLIDLVGELVIAHVMAAQMVESFTPECLPRLRDAVAAMERNTRELHERVMSVRMLPIGSLFQRYARVVYDIAQSTGKQIRLETEGEETEIDKSMLELLGDPLTHLIRNAADHGIEAAATRLACGKPEEGVIHLRAFHRSGRVVIEISDDGAGIDTARVRAKAIERGLIPAEAQLSEEQLRMLIFEPGFSTRDAVSDLSGRGVGMDVVKRNVQQLSGSVSLASQLGSGSTVSIELPLTLAILEGLLVRVADRTLVLPLLSVVETVAPSMGKIVRVAEQGEVIVIREESIPVLRLCRFLGMQRDASGPAAFSGSDPCSESIERRLVVVVETGRRKIGLVVDELLGQQQVVVKSLEKNLHKVEGLMGATILGDGCVAPILDVAALAGMNLFSLLQQARPAARNGPSGMRAQKALSAPIERRESLHELV